MTRRVKVDGQIDVEFESLGQSFLNKHPKIKITKTEDLEISRYSTIDDLILSLSHQRDRILSIGGTDITVDLDYSRGYYDDIDFEPTVSYKIEESELEYRRRLVALKRAADKAKATRKKEKIDQEAAEKELLAKLKAKYEK